MIHLLDRIIQKLRISVNDICVITQYFSSNSGLPVYIMNG